MVHELYNADLIDRAFAFLVCGSLRRLGRFLPRGSLLSGFLGRGSGAAAGGQGQGHETCRKCCDHFLFEFFPFHLFSSFVF